MDRPRACVAIAAVALSTAGCRRRTAAVDAGADSGPRPAARTAPASKPDADALPPAAPGLPPERRAVQVVGGKERVVDAELARHKGLTIVDLSDGWAPLVFADGVAPDGAILPNRYRAVFVGLANDRADGDGQPLESGDKNYLELFGIPPSLSVLRERFLTDAARTCDRDVDRAKLLAVDEIPMWGTSTEKKELATHRIRGLRIEAARQKAAAPSLEAFAQLQPKWAKEVAGHIRFEAERQAFVEVEKRLACEGLLDPARHKPGLTDIHFRTAVADFQQKHRIATELAELKAETLKVMTTPLLENDFAALRRVLTERAVHAAGIVEDGSAPTHKKKGPATYLGSDGQRHPVPDLESADAEALLARLGLARAEDAVAFFRRHAPEDFRSLRVAVRFAPLPEYYGGQMELAAEIDRGDVWYDFPWDAKGARLRQTRVRYPSFTLYVHWKDERVPLVRWRTTIGGWRSELAADGEEYYRYKESDVGTRVWRHVVAAPVWIPPPSSPLGSMVKEKKVNGAFVKVTNYDETGPGYLSAYGLVAAIHEKRIQRGSHYVYWDNGIRTHGSFDYMSLRGRFSHGCHRLYNHLAMRLFSWVFAHHKAKALGQVQLGMKTSFWWNGEMFDLRLPSRGFYYELDPPIPVETLRGRIRGAHKHPITTYVRKPGVEYRSRVPPPTSSSPEAKAGGAGGSP